MSNDLLKEKPVDLIIRGVLSGAIAAFAIFTLVLVWTQKSQPEIVVKLGNYQRLANALTAWEMVLPKGASNLVSIRFATGEWVAVFYLPGATTFRVLEVRSDAEDGVGFLLEQDQKAYLKVTLGEMRGKFAQ